MIAEQVGNPVQDGPDYVAPGRLAFAEDDFVATRDHWQSAFREQRSSGNARGAARVAADLRLPFSQCIGSILRPWRTTRRWPSSLPSNLLTATWRSSRY